MSKEDKQLYLELVNDDYLENLGSDCLITTPSHTVPGYYYVRKRNHNRFTKNEFISKIHQYQNIHYAVIKLTNICFI